MGYFMVLFLVVAIFILASLSMAGGYYSRAVNARDREQAFHTAYGMAEALAWEFTEETPGDCVPVILAALEGDGRLELTGLPEGIENCRATVEYEEEINRLKLCVVSVCGTQEQAVTAVLQHLEMGSGEGDGEGDEEGPETAGGWCLVGYENESDG